MWRNQKFCQIWRNFKILHMTDVKKSEIYPVFGCEICFVAIYAIFCLNCFVAIYALLCGKKLSRKLYRWRKNDKYEVCLRLAQKVQKYAFFYFKQFSEIYICFEGKCLQYPAHVEIPYCGEILELEGFRRDNIKLHCLHLFDFSPVCLQMSPQIACLREGIYTSAAICI